MIEVMVGVLLLAIAMAGLVPLFISGFAQSSEVRFKSTANNIAREKMELIRQLDYREIVDAEWLEGRFGVTEEVRGVTYDISYEVALMSEEASGKLKEVTVQVGWTAPPAVSPARLSTMFHQQYVGPRISYMEVKEPDPETDPLGSPFDLLKVDTTHMVYVHVAEADWGLVYENLNETGMTARDVHLELSRVDGLGNQTSFLTTEGDKEITGLTAHYNSTTGLVDDVYITYPVDSGDLPDGYWEFRAVLYNQYNEPGNYWSLRLRVENGAPAAPTGFVAVPQFGDESVRLYWSGGPELDRKKYVIQRRTKEGSDWKSWVTLDDNVDPNATSYLDQGSIALMTDPWGLAVTDVHDYQYRIWAVDIAGKVGTTAEAGTTVPPSVAITTTTVDPSLTTTTLFTTTTEPSTTTYTITVVNLDANTSYSILIEPGNPAQSDISTTVGKKATITVSDLPAGDYSITATSTKNTAIHVTAAFTLGPAYDPAIPVLEINL